jgi:hypothetical protein
LGGLAFRQARASDSTETQFRPHATTRERPQHGAGVIDFAHDSIVKWAGIVDPEWLEISLYGVGPARCHMLFRLWGWSEVEDQEGTPLKLYKPIKLADVTAMLGPESALWPGAREAEQISSNLAGGPIPVVATFDDCLEANARRSRWIEFEFAKPNGSRVESMNAIWKILQ